MSMKNLMATGLIGALLLLATAPADGAETKEVTMQGVAFNPKAITIAPGDTIRFTNRENITHDVLIEGYTATANGTLADGYSGNLSLDQSWSFTFGKEGTVKVRCVIHSIDFSNGMVMKVTVAKPRTQPGFEAALLLMALSVAAALLLSRK